MKMFNFWSNPKRLWYLKLENLFIKIAFNTWKTSLKTFKFPKNNNNQDAIQFFLGYIYSLIFFKQIFCWKIKTTWTRTPVNKNTWLILFFHFRHLRYSYHWPEYSRLIFWLSKILTKQDLLANIEPFGFSLTTWALWNIQSWPGSPEQQQ